MNTTTRTYAHATGELTTLALQELEHFVKTANGASTRRAMADVRHASEHSWMNGQANRNARGEHAPAGARIGDLAVTSDD